LQDVIKEMLDTPTA